MKNKIYLSILLLMLGSGVLHAQSDYYFNVNYSMSNPFDETADYTGDYSWRGMNMESYWMMNDRFGAGFSVGWHVMTEKVSGSFVDGSRTVTGTQLRYLNLYPIMAEGRFHFGEGLGLGTTPYLGLGIGTLRSNQRTEIGVFVVENNNWHFLVAPSVGFLVPMKSGSMFNLGVRYHYAPETSDGMPYSFLGVNVGFAWGD